MESTIRRYTSPATPPPLAARPVPSPAVPGRPTLSLRSESQLGHVRAPLVSFAWGPVARSYFRR